MAENLNKQPSKGILKNSSSFDIHDRQAAARRSKGGAKWDEMNIMATLHPPDKDYGHMKIDEPKTPYNFEGLEDNDLDTLDAADLAERIRNAATSKPKALLSSDTEEEEDEDLTPEERLAKREFETKRKKHYNEFYAVKLARKLLEKDLAEDDDEDAQSTSSATPKPIRNAAARKPKAVLSSDEEEDEDLTPEESLSKQEFENKMHRNDFDTVKLLVKDKVENNDEDTQSTSSLKP